MREGSIARRYARALFGLALEEQRVEPWSRALAELEQAVESRPDLADAVSNPVYTREQRRALAGELAAALRLDRLVANFLMLLADRNRFGYLGAIVKMFGELADQALGRIRARVVSATPLEPAEAQRLAQRFAEASHAQVIVEREVDPSLLGGVVTQVGSLVYDGSIRTQLQELRRALKS